MSQATISISQLRQMNSTDLRECEQILIVVHEKEPLAVVLKYSDYKVLQTELETYLQLVQMLSDKRYAELSGTLAATQ